MDNKSFLKLNILVVLLITGISSCNEPEDNLLREVTVSLTEENRNFLFNTSAARSKARSNGIGGPAGFIFRLGGGVFSPEGKGRSSHSLSPLMTMRKLVAGSYSNVAGRSANEIDPNELPDCFTEYFKENEDGSYVYILDFGEGCDLFGDFFIGKITETGIYLDNSFEGTTKYDDFGTDFWEINGNYNYEGIWEFPENAQDSLEFDWSAEYRYDYSMEENYVDEGETFMVTSNGNGKENLDEDGYTIMNQENEYIYGTGEKFTSVVDVPLHLSYSCGEEIFMFVTGKESGNYSYEDLSTSYSIDYGDGTCDNIITVTENGEEYVIDMDEVYDDLESNSDDD